MSYQDIVVTPEEIEAVKKEYSKKYYFGTREHIKLDDNMAIYVIKGRKGHEAYMNSVHKSHKMTKWSSTILAPCGTPRFYSIRECKKCGGEQYYAAAGRFIDPELKEKCKGK
jgi:hypothetical protein